MEKEKNEFVIDSDVKAEWALRKIKEAEEERDRQKNVANEMIEFYLNAREKAEEECENTKGYFYQKLYEYAESITMQETKARNLQYKLPSGKLR